METNTAARFTVLFSVCAACFFAFGGDGQESYSFVKMWPELPQPWYFRDPYGVTVDTSGNVYVADYYKNRIQKFTCGGTFITRWGTQGSGNGQFDEPRGLAVDTSGNVYVADTYNHRIQKFTSDGTFIRKWGSWGSGNGEFDWPCGVAVDTWGNVYVADTYNDRIQKFRPRPVIKLDESEPSWIKFAWPVMPEKIYKIYWTDDLATGTLHWDEVDGPALDDFIDKGDGTMSWTDKGTDPDMAAKAPGDVPSRFYMVAAD